MSARRRGSAHGPPGDESSPSRGRRALSDIWIGDVLQLWGTVDAMTPAERQRVAEVLGFTYRPPAAHTAPVDERSTPPGAEEVPHASPFRGDATLNPGQFRPRAVVESSEAAADAIALPARLESPPTKDDRLPTWAVVTDVIPADEPRHLQHQPSPAPLFNPRWTRAMLGALCATLVREGPIDFGQVFDAICRRRPLAVLPREPVWTLRLGIQLLVDESASLSLYGRDVAALIAALEAVVGRDRTGTLRFAGAPTRGVRLRPFAPLGAWRPPAPGTPIVVVSDFGLIRGGHRRGASTVDEWERVAVRARAAGCSVLGIVPLAPGRWPAALRRAIRLLRWDRRATAALARRVARGELG